MAFHGCPYAVPHVLAACCTPTLVCTSLRHAPLRVPEGCISLIAGLLLAVCSFETVSPSRPGFSLPRAQCGSGSERRAGGRCLSPSPRHAWGWVREASGSAGDSRV